ncbi:fimbrial biogenesis outer membrane usher protein [Pseudomonas tremae]|uniref:fimbria/pilus outer membrane usher protein n=1 Tax=Pseudomonas syringae group TaxID=136849 RepID=UPI0001AF3658|nr:MULTISPECIES: fimbria/pilus outer membrane usher protein [Pseudomonas syringae group]MCQ3014943.1 fimbrial biogenesis outer membrane usher protein [Pseudomonas tremae]QGL56531.1 fimbria/pilus outer membrane usher protein [Pseudomonas coronafaciens pv. oryzae str. 1_6]RMM37602.1 Fimbrial bioproteinsis outer membrane usher protein [Pseudomonas coronafaciens pv. oryzae]
MLFHIGPSRPGSRLRLTFLFIVSSGVPALQTAAAQAAQPVKFQSGFMRQDSMQNSATAEMALASLSNERSLAPGRHLVSLFVNLKYVDEYEVEFLAHPEDGRLMPCLSSNWLGEWGVRLDGLLEPLDTQNVCFDLLSRIPGALIDFDTSKMAVSLSIPQIAMRRDVAGHVDPARWDSGINAAFVNYQVSAQQGSSRYGGSQTSDDMYLNGGINLGEWRLRSSQSLRQDPDGKRQWTRAYTYLQRDLPGTSANLTIGETSTPGEVFKSLPLKGMVVATDLGMLPDVLQGYAPIIRGVAQTRAKLEILQNGYPVYSTYVSPGPYEINDLSITGGSGELEIVLTEADGLVRRFTQPYSTLSNLLRKGVWRYSAAIGRYNAANGTAGPPLLQGTLTMGLGQKITVYGGMLASDFYRAGNIGIARDLGALGALAIDMTHASTDIDTQPDGSVNGMSYAIKYGKAFQTGTSLRFAGYRYSTEGYRDFDEAVRERSRDSNYRGSRRSRLEAAAFQNLGNAGSLSLSLSQEDFWNTTYQQRQFQLNFNTQLKGVSYSLYASQSLSDERSGSENDRQIGISASFPLDLGHSSSASMSYTDSGGKHSQTARLSGSASHGRLGYSAALSNDQDSRQSASLSTSWQAPFASVGAGVTQGNDYRSVSMNASGAILLHEGGFELGPYLSDTSALIEVSGISGVGVTNAPGVKTNERGFALVPYMRPYRVNYLALQTDDLGPDVEIDNGAAQVIPRRGAIVKSTFAARTVNRLALTISSAEGLPLPFGAQVTDLDGILQGVVSQGGQLLLSIDNEPQTLNVRWGEQEDQRCKIALDPQGMEQKQGYRLQSLVCR